MRKGVELRRPLIAAEVIQLFEDDVEKIGREGSPASRLRRLVEVEVDHTDRIAEKYYEACCEIWEMLGRRKCPAFFQAVLDHCLLPLFGQRGRAVERQLNLHHYPTAQPSEIDDAIARYGECLASLRTKWRNRLEIEAHNSQLLEQRREAGAEAEAEADETIRANTRKPGPKRRRDREFVAFAEGSGERPRTTLAASLLKNYRVSQSS